MRARRLLRHKANYNYPSATIKTSGRKKLPGGKIVLLTALSFFLLLIISASIFLKDISTQIAVSDASDIVTVSVNSAVNDLMNKGEYSGDYFVDFQKTEQGEVTAISCNMARINALSSLILEKVVGSTNSNTITVGIPVGNLTGISLLMGRGPKVPVKIVMMTSSRVEFNNSIVTAGINQTKHQINLEVIVDVDILVPWGTESTQVVCEVLIADTVVVGKVPQTYLNMQ